MKTKSANQQGKSVEIRGDALRYWECRRLAYNGALALVALGWLIFTWPHFRPAFNLQAAGALCVLAILANLCYSAVYLADIPFRRSAARFAWLRWRWLVWLIGALFAVAIEMYWIADEIYPDPFGP